MKSWTINSPSVTKNRDSDFFLRGNLTMLKNKHIILGVTGGIAAYKIPLLVRQLKKAGAEVKIVMTKSAAQFVTAETLATLSGNEVIIDIFPEESSRIKSETWHVSLG